MDDSLLGNMKNSNVSKRKIRKNIMVFIILVTMTSSALIPLATANPKPKSIARGKGSFVFDYYHYDEQTDNWSTDFPLVCDLNVKVTGKYHPVFGHGKIDLVCHEEGAYREEDAKIMLSTNIFEPEFIDASPTRFISKFEGTADLIWGYSKVGTNISVIVWDGTPFDTSDGCRIEIGDVEPIVLGEKQQVSLDSQTVEIMNNYDTIVVRGNYTTSDGIEIPDVVVIGGPKQYKIGEGDFITLSGYDPLIIEGSNLSIDGVQIGSNAYYLDGKGTDNIIIGGGKSLRIGGIEPIYLHLGDTIVADGGYTVLTGSNDLHDSSGDDTIFIKI